MKEIKLTRGLVTLVDDEDYEWLSKMPWHALRGDKVGSLWYAGKQDADGKTVRMHRMLMGLKHGDPRKVDHRDRNSLNNTRGNLRIATHAQNMYNVRFTRVSSTSGYIGVYLDPRKRNPKFQAAINVNGRRQHIGMFETAEEAALAYNETATRLRGEFACLNEIK